MKDRKFRRRVLTVFLLCAVLELAVLAASGAEESTGENHIGDAASGENTMWVIAHRAGAAAAPENTLSALKKAIAAEADMAEIDVRMTRDGRLVVLHDGNLERTAGVDRNVWEMDYAEVRSLDVGAWYSSAFAGERVPSLEEMLAASQDRIPLMIELKPASVDQDLVEKAVRLIRAADMEGQCILACSDLEPLRRSKELAPELDTVYIGGTLDLALCGLAYVDGFSIYSGALTEEMVEQAHGEGKKVYVWTVNTAAELRAARKLAVDGVVTDDPALAVRLRFEET